METIHLAFGAVLLAACGEKWALHLRILVLICRMKAEARIYDDDL